MVSKEKGKRGIRTRQDESIFPVPVNTMKNINQHPCGAGDENMYSCI